MQAASSMQPEAGESKLDTVLNRFRSTKLGLAGSKRDAEPEPSSRKPKIRKAETVVAQGLSAIPQPSQDEETSTKNVLDWPVEPQFVDPGKVQQFSSLGVSKKLCDRLAELGFKNAFAVQTAVIPAVLEAQCSLSPDPLPSVLVNSFTGSGKTLAYLVPIIDTLSACAIPGLHKLQALILLPTKVLMSQVHTVAEQISKGTGLRVLTLKAGRSLTRERKILDEFLPDIVISAPGRLVDHVKQAPDLLANLKFVVVDEADRLVGQSFQNWTSSLQRVLPTHTHASTSALWQRPPQRLIFSATLTRDPAKLKDLQVSLVPSKPKLYVIGKAALDGNDEFALPEKLAESLLAVKHLSDKPLGLVNELLKPQHKNTKTIVFVRNNESAARLAFLVKAMGPAVFGAQAINAFQCSGEMRPQDRTAVLRAFEQCSSGVLVCTDFIARGMDMNVDCVVNYDLPMGPREYVHRVGRTARAKASGLAITITSSEKEKQAFAEMQKRVSRFNTVQEESVEFDDSVDMQKYQNVLDLLSKEILAPAAN